MPRIKTIVLHLWATSLCYWFIIAQNDPAVKSPSQPASESETQERGETAAVEAPLPPKRLIICCDGTWNDSVSTNNPLTNVARFSRCVNDRTNTGILQIVYYHTGVGRGTSKISNSIDGAIGRGIGTNIRNAYNFICQNFNFRDGNDEIFLVGFSRGAFTVRCIASLIDDIGLLTKFGLSRLYEVWSLWKNQGRDKDALSQKVMDLEQAQLLKREITIKACGVWDTVSAIGFQLPYWMPQWSQKNLAFVNTDVPSCIQNAFHAVALNEERSTFWPLLWKCPTREGVNFQQSWFLGSHSDVGGGNEDAGLANITLIWMIANFQTIGMSFDTDHIKQFLVNKEIGIDITKRASKNRNWESIVLKIELGNVYKSLTPTWRVMGRRSRSPGLQYAKPDHGIGSSGAYDDLGLSTGTNHGSSLNRPIEVEVEELRMSQPPVIVDPVGNSNDSRHDTVHFTVRVMMAAKYRNCPVLEQLHTYLTEDSPPKVAWKRITKKRSVKDENGYILELKVNGEEQELLKLWTEAWDERGLRYVSRKTRKVICNNREASYSREKQEEVSFSMHEETAQDGDIKINGVHTTSQSFGFGISYRSRQPIIGVPNNLPGMQEFSTEKVDIATFLSSRLEEVHTPTVMYNGSN
ncbi:hypothetical protein EJ08DRAFT_739706 [Tothia fuscella]|uniref:T6SS Phospholipase effector Tle1-like catalytic domain-containing protein n=1 Tax=Tothia fuscella TaxID=1048955 RepID=A0A9P4NDN7_9PEZI|nr:hypothetical protein EJ08DRAFT_739706 [Tothia fuscella]